MRNILKHFFLFSLLSFSFAFGQLELGVSQNGTSCNVRIKNHLGVQVSLNGEEVIVKFDPKIYPIIFNNCNFVTVDKAKRTISLSGGRVTSKSACKTGAVCLIAFEGGGLKIPSNIEANTNVKIAKKAPAYNTKEPLYNVKKYTPKAKKPINNTFLVVLDPGHGGKDPGAIGKNGTQEKDITLRYAKFIANFLRNAGYNVYLTREKDEYLKLYERIDKAMLKNADIFISIHADSAKNKEAKGATIYTLAPSAVNEATKNAEERTNISGNFVENEEDEDLIFNILNIQHNSNVRQSFEFGEILRRRMGRMGIRFTAVSIRSANFAVLKAPTFPAILLELGYLSNYEDQKMLQSKEYMGKVALSIKNALDEVK